MKLTLPVCLAILLACAPAPAPVQPADQQASIVVRLAEDFELKVGETARLADSDVRLTFEKVAEDSRCPIDAVCIWAGQALVVLRSRGPSVDTLATVDATKAPRELRANGFVIELRELRPAPRASSPQPGPYVLVLRATAAPK